MAASIRFSFFCLVFLWQSCCDSRFTDPAPSPYIYFAKSPPAASTDTAVTFARIYALKGNRDLYTGPSAFPRYGFQVPLALGADATTYIFEGASRTDTLTLAYDRKAEFVSRACGAYLSIKNIRIGEPTSFSNVRISTDSSFVYGNDDYDFVVVVSL